MNIKVSAIKNKHWYNKQYASYNKEPIASQDGIYNTQKEFGGKYYFYKNGIKMYNIKYKWLCKNPTIMLIQNGITVAQVVSYSGTPPFFSMSAIPYGVGIGTLKVDFNGRQGVIVSDIPYFDITNEKGQTIGYAKFKSAMQGDFDFNIDMPNTENDDILAAICFCFAIFWRIRQSYVYAG